MLHDQMQHTRCDSVAAAHFVEHQPRPSFPSGLHYTTPDSHSLSSSSLTICLSFWHCAQWTFSQGRRPVTQLVVFRVSPFACPMHPAHLPSVTVLLPPPPSTHTQQWMSQNRRRCCRTQMKLSTHYVGQLTKCVQKGVVVVVAGILCLATLAAPRGRGVSIDFPLRPHSAFTLKIN